ncbi:hypothetical protein [Lysinibacillus sp. NPDC093692]|uniref:hypothetical protein n=1 Tax=Lysinibacillus sp. NPDC093692 TaxID=3390578 RepID=UPI003D07FBF8
MKEPYLYYRIIASSNSTATSTLWVVYKIDFIAERKSGVLTETANWKNISDSLPTSQQFIEQGMNNSYPLLDRTVTELEPLTMTNNSEILGVGEIGKVFSKTIDLKKYFDIRSIRTEVK